MKDELFAFGDARVRWLEAALFNRAFLESLIGAAGQEEAFSLLASRGWSVPEDGDRKKLIADREKQIWDEVTRLVQDRNVLGLLTLKNDFYNLKAALKALVSSRSAEGLWLFPTSLDLASLPEILAKKDYEKLPEFLRKPAAEVYSMLVSSSDGQTADFYLDRAALLRQTELAALTGSEFLSRWALLDRTLTDLRVALRCASLGMDADRVLPALCGTDVLPAVPLAEAAAESEDAVRALAAQSGLEDAARAAAGTAVDFEKFCDDAQMRLMKENVFRALGVEIIVAWWYAAVTELKAVGVILQCKALGMDGAASERIRELYV